MSTEGVQHVLIDHWAVLEKEPPPSGGKLRTTGLPVESDAGQLLAAVDSEGRRHLLVPILPSQHVGSHPFGANLRFAERTISTGPAFHRYADVVCLNVELDDLFTEVCSDVMLAVAGNPGSALRVTTSVLSRWRSLFVSSSSVLTESKLVGLFSELLVLRELLRRNSSAAAYWRGPDGHRHDFDFGTNAIEVKSTSATDGRRVGIHGLDQLDPPQNGRLWLCWNRLERRSGALTLNALVSEVLRLTDDYAGLLGKLGNVGYRTADREWYLAAAFESVESSWYSVDGSFPRLTSSQLKAAGVAIDVVNASYSIDLPDPGTFGLRASAVDDILTDPSKGAVQ
uniref:PD-(D/E)XK motif protein n=1 Tax=unclassified Rhodococcus (in: high G+C Gram-positive bacteria) TaxID=192944 RepID=UPI0015950B3B|nr:MULTISPECIES: PD-(D/E)XK motif protein [unclassified Rhodococcus (in: high G+C Gram-positive bacteria)]